jgi:hypothetical protein
VSIRHNPPGSQDVVEIFQLQEGPPSVANWVLQNTYRLHETVEIYAITSNAAVGGGTFPTPPLGIGQQIHKRFFPDGTSEGFTIYLQSRKQPGDRFRIFVLPLSGVATTAKGW